ncbi:MAG: alpha/beta hydrolase [Nostocaceae cyanobacterium]|nr:alpha/beta hydrolase [Nostocaceae cyanobacterium]
MAVNRTWRQVFLGTVSAIPVGIASLHAPSSQAADTVVVRFGLWEDSIPVSDLRYIAEKGKVPPNLSGYARRLSRSQRSQVLAGLQTKIPIGVLAINNLLNNQIGTTILNDLASATPRKDNAGVQALRAALILGSASPQGLSILSVIEAYPSQRLVIDLPQTFKVVGNLNTSFWQTQRFMAAIAPRLAAQRPNLNLPFDPTKPGSAPVFVQKLSFEDKQRQRLIPVDVYTSSATTADKPVVVLSHGLASIRTDMLYLAEHLASHGYPVVALEHPGSNQTNLNLATQGKVPVLRGKEVLERPKDISFVLDELEKLNKTGDNPLKGKLATNNVMVIGYSYGGSTALLLAGAELQLEKLKQRCQDNLVTFSLGEGFQCVSQFLPENRASVRDVRIKQAIAFNPTASLLFGDDGLSKISVPTFVLAASADKTTPALIEQIAPFEKIPEPKWLAGIVGATHLSVKDPSTTMDQPTMPSTLYSGDEVVGEKAVDVRNYVKAISLAMAAQLTSEADKYAVFLTPEYALSASSSAFPIRLVKEIPPEAQVVVKEYLQGKTP